MPAGLSGRSAGSSHASGVHQSLVGTLRFPAASMFGPIAGSVIFTVPLSGFFPSAGFVTA